MEWFCISKERHSANSMRISYIMDVVKIYAHVKSVSTIINEAALKAADYTGDGKINIMDVAKLYAHVKGAN